jgi:hypothetical protein
VPTYSGSNRYTIDSDFGVFEADGNQMLMRRVAEINAIAKLQAISQTKEFTQAAAQAAAAPLQVAQDSGPVCVELQAVVRTSRNRVRGLT